MENITDSNQMPDPNTPGEESGYMEYIRRLRTIELRELLKQEVLKFKEDIISMSKEEFL